MRRRGQAASALAAGLCFVDGIGLACLHPIAPGWALAAFVAAVALVARWPRTWLWLLPAAAPLLDFAPWTGGLAIEEFDLLVLAAAAALHGLQAWRPPAALAPVPRMARGTLLAAVAFAALTAASLARGVLAAGGSPTPIWFQGYSDPMNAWRVAKSVLWMALLWRPLCREFAVDRDSAVRRLAGGMLGGLLVVSLAAIWERAAYAGLRQFSGHYRTTALFWEMHVGGGAIDAYLALAAPFVAWALWSQKARLLWTAGAVLALLGGYTALTTFSRGVYLAVAVPLIGLVALRAWRRSQGDRRRFLLGGVVAAAALVVIDAALACAFAAAGPLAAGLLLAAVAVLGILAVRRFHPYGWRTLASFGLALVLALEVVAVLGLGTFLRERLSESNADYVSRRQHWGQAIGLMRGAADWTLGIGAGRLPPGYGTQVPGVEFPGAAAWTSDASGQGAVRLAGRAAQTQGRGMLMLEQRIALKPGRGHHVELDLRVATPSELFLRVCETHLLYANQCQASRGWIFPAGPLRQRLSVGLPGAPLSRGNAAWPRRAAFSMAVINAGGAVDVGRVQVYAPDGTPLLSNGDFSNGLAHWLPVAMDDFTPWHADNLYVDLLVERGLPALLAFLAGAWLVLRRLLCRAAASIPFAPFLAAAIGGGLCVGLVDSVMDVPRVAFLLWLLLAAGAQLGAGVSAPASPSAPGA